MTIFKPALLATAATFALGMGVAMAEDAPGATSDIMIAADEASPGSGVGPADDAQNEGSLSAPEKDPMGADETGGMSDDAAANVPGTSAEGDADNENQGSLSAPEKDTDKM